ncbi:MAG: molybdopterin-dependent oxidoreductase [Actinopolymorphaceae bacterium]
MRGRSWWRSPIRGPWLTSILGLILVVGIPVQFLTGLLSYASYDPWLGGRFNDPTPGKGLLGFYLFEWPTRPAWLYWVTQGIHVVGGLMLAPVVLAKLWSVIPRLFAWPPVRSPAHALERLSLLLLVGGGIFVFVTGILNIQYWYVFPAGFYASHFYGAWVFVAVLAFHVAVKARTMVSTLRSRSVWNELRVGLSDTRPEPADATVLVSREPAAPTMSRRGALGFVGAGSALLGLLSAGQTVGGPLRPLAVLAPRGATEGPGPNDFVVNKTAAHRRITRAQTGAAWRLDLRGLEVLSLSRDDLLALPLHSERLPIACVEGWTTVQTWTGVRLADLSSLAGVGDPTRVAVESLQRGGGFGSANLAGNQVRDPGSLLALRVNGADLSLDHGFPARIVVPNAPGVHCTKWVSQLTFWT